MKDLKKNKPSTGGGGGTRKKRKQKIEYGDKIKKYEHNAKRLNNPHAGLDVKNSDDVKNEKVEYSLNLSKPHDSKYNPNPENNYDPDNDPSIKPTLMWAGKYKNSSISIDVLPLHVHERIDPTGIFNKLAKPDQQCHLDSFFERDENRLDISKDLQFYQHKNNWSNRLIAGDSLLVMNSLLTKECMGNTIQMVYIDPPYGIDYSSNFQATVCKVSKSQNDDDKDLTEEPEMLRAFRDTWEYGIHSYLTSLRDRLVLVQKLLNESGSCFVQISDVNVHFVKMIMEEIFGKENFIGLISFRTKSTLGASHIPGIVDYIVWFAKNKTKVKTHHIYSKKKIGRDTPYTKYELAGERFDMTDEQKDNQSLLPPGARVYRFDNLVSTGRTESCVFDFEVGDIKVERSDTGRSWRTNRDGMMRLVQKNRIDFSKKNKNKSEKEPEKPLKIIPQFVSYFDEYPVSLLTNIWSDTQGATGKRYVVQTSEKVVQRCMAMTTDPGDLVLDPTCGSGSTALVAEKMGRRWITCDTSRISVNIAKQGLITSVFDYYKLKDDSAGVSKGFVYQSVPHVTLEQIAQDLPHGNEPLYDNPQIKTNNNRVAGPFTVETISPPIAKSIDELHFQNQREPPHEGGSFQEYWKNLMQENGIRGKSGQRIEFSYLKSDPTTKWIHAFGKTLEKNSRSKTVAIAFGPEYGSIGGQQISNTIMEILQRNPKPDLLIFAGMHIDTEAIKQIDKTEISGIKVLKAEINKDVLSYDLKKSDKLNEPFWLLGQPDVSLQKDKGDFSVKVNGYDYFDIKNGEIESGNTSKIVMWLLDIDYDGKSLCPTQIFFPMPNSSGQKRWVKLTKDLKSYIDEEMAMKFTGTISLPFQKGENECAAIKIIDDRGVETIKVLSL